MAIEHGASALGLVSAMPSGPGVIPDDAIAQVGPFALDVCSGVRTNGHLDEGKLARLFAAVTAAS